MRVLMRLAAAALVLAVTACRPNQSLEGQAKDAKIATEIKSKLVSRVSASTLTSIDVNVTNGVATLAGPVHSADESRQIEEIARAVPGVTDVKNALQVMTESSSAPAVVASPTAAPSGTPRPGAL